MLALRCSSLVGGMWARPVVRTPAVDGVGDSWTTDDSRSMFVYTIAC